MAKKTDRRHLTPEVLAAWKAADYMALHRALGLTPWNISPLPVEIEVLGCDQDEPREWMGAAQRRDWRNARLLQAELLKIAGWPDCRKAYEENLKEAEEWLGYCQEQVLDRALGHDGTDSDAAARWQKLQEAKEQVDWRRQLLARLDEKGAA